MKLKKFVCWILCLLAIWVLVACSTPVVDPLPSQEDPSREESETENDDGVWTLPVKQD